MVQLVEENTSGLWDRDGYSAGNSCFSYNNPPYFTQQTTDNIEMQICGRETINQGGDTLIRLIDLYVK